MKLPEGGAMMISLLCHLLVALMVTLTFPGRPVTPRPMFIFLGSILESYEFVSLPANPLDPDLVLKGAVKVPSPQSQFYPTSENLLKPSFFRNMETGTKNYLKSSFQQPKESPSKDLREIGIETTVPQRLPLRLNLR